MDRVSLDVHRFTISDQQLLIPECFSVRQSGHGNLRFGAQQGLHEKKKLVHFARRRAYKARCVSSTKPATDSGLWPSAGLNGTETRLAGEESDDLLLLKRRGCDIAPKLNGTCIYLVGMMGSGKSTVGKFLAEALSYDFLDSDKLIEDAAGGMTVAQFFKQKDEKSFREAETEVLKQLSHGRHAVVSTGGGIVVSPVNWQYMRSGITVWLDVPLEDLAERVVSVGMHSRPLLGQSEGDSPYHQALSRLSSIFEFRQPFYSNSDIVVSFKRLASQLEYPHVRDITPTVICLQVLEEINNYITHSRGFRDTSSNAPSLGPKTATLGS